MQNKKERSTVYVNDLKSFHVAPNPHKIGEDVSLEILNQFGVIRDYLGIVVFTGTNPIPIT